MERIFRGVIQIGGEPETEEGNANWLRLQEHSLEFPTEEDLKVYEYLKTYHGQMASPPDFNLIKEYFEKQDDVETVTRLDEISKAQLYIRTNYLSIVRSEQDRQQVKALVLLCRDAGAIAEQGRNVDKPVNGKKILRGVNDAVNYIFEHLGEFTRVESGEKLEGVVSEDAEEIIDEYTHIETTNQFANRNLFGLEPVDTVCKGHRIGEYWVHTAFTGELKCLAGEASVFDHATGKRRTMAELHDSMDAPTVTALYGAGKSSKLTLAKASKVTENGIRPVFELTLESGRRTMATSNHGFLGLHGWKELSEFSPGDWIAVPKRTHVSDPCRHFLDEEVKMLGHLIGDGTIPKDTWLTASNKEIREDFKELLMKMGCVVGSTDSHMSLASETSNQPHISRLRSILEQFSLYGRTAHTKVIPDELYGLPDHQVALFLGALWSTDKSTSDHGRFDQNHIDMQHDIRYYSMSERLCLGVQAFLLRLGIHSTITHEKAAWVVDVRSKTVFCDLVHVAGKDYRSDAVQKCDILYPVDIIPDGVSAVVGTRKLHKSQMCGETIEGSVLEHFRHVPRVASELDGDILWERVQSIEFVGEEMTYDLEVPEHHSFVVDDIVSHNTTLALNYAYNNVMVYGKNIFYCILEMPYTQLRRQLYAIHSSHGKFVTEWYDEDGYTGLDYRKIRDGELDARGKERLRIVAQDFKESAKGRLYVWRPPGDVAISDIQHKAEMFHNRWGCDGMVIDHLGLVKPSRRVSDYVVSLNSVVREGRLMALNFGRGRAVPVLALFQLNRQGKLRADKNDGRYDIAAISYANEIEKSADVITYTYLNDALRASGKFFMGNLKNRDNPLFDRMIGKILWQSKRIRAIESGLLDLDHDQILDASRQISQGIGLGPDLKSMLMAS